MGTSETEVRVHSEEPITDDVRQAQRISGSLIWGQVGRILDVGLGLLFSVLVVRALGPKDYSAYAVAWSVVTVTTLFASLGYGETFNRFLPVLHLSGDGKAATFVRWLLGERILISTAAALVIWASAGLLAGWTKTPALRGVIGLIATLVVSQGVWELLSAYYTATLRMREYATVRALGQLISIAVALTLFFGYGIHIWVPLAAMLASYLATSLVYTWKVRQVLTLPARPVDLATARRFGGYVWLTNLATFGLASQIDVLLIAVLFTDSTQVGFYNVAVLLLGRLYTFLTGWTAVLMPAASEAHVHSGDAGLARSFTAYMKINLLALLPPFIFAAAASTPLIIALFKVDFAPAAPLLVLFAGFSLVSTLVGANVCHPLLYVADQQRTLLGLRISAGVLNVLLDVWLIPWLGAAGAVIATGSSNLVTHLVEFVLLRRIVAAEYPIAMAAKLLAASMLAALPVLFLSGDPWTRLIGGAVLFAGVFVVAMRWFRPLSAQDRDMLAQAMPRLRPVLAWFA